ncbi:MAG: PD40 domain-containing protein [Candidatus Krumholzibacteriota bacterium]|nr:PD40 domain-containing protein [Candidatus Krumholzibacteriota bacterium]
MNRRLILAASLSILLALTLTLPAPALSGEARLLRYPSIMGNRVAFVYAGDIWAVAATGGTARRVTSFQDGLEVFPKISPDGKWIAFSGEYAGTRQIYVVPWEGGVPKRLTFYPDVGVMPPRGGYDYIPYDWTPDGRILVRHNLTPYGRRVGKYFLVDPARPGFEEPLQIPEGGPASLSPDGKKIAYSIKSREFRTWKRYTAGRAQDVFIYDLEKNEIEKIADWEGTDNFPLWIGDAIYYTSDRTKTLNLWKYDIVSGETSQVTNFDEYDVLWPSRGGDRIVFEKGGYLFLHDTATGETTRIAVDLGSDKPFLRPVFKNVAGDIESFGLSPSAKRVAFGARGELFTVPAEHGAVRNVSNTPAVREMYADWSPDGKYISYVSEAGGDYEIWIRPQDGSGEPRQLTTNSDAWILSPVWSPDSKRIAWTDKKNRLWFRDVEGGAKTKVDECRYSAVRSHSFSADGAWIVYVKDDENGMTNIWAWSIEKKERVHLTGGITDDWDPVFSTDGKYVYFVSRRDFDYPERRFDSRIYVGTLSRETPAPLGPQSDEEEPADDEKKNGDDKKKDEKTDGDEAPVITAIDDGFAERVAALPIPPGRYRGLTAVEGGVLYLDGDGNLMMFDLGKRKAEEIMKNVRGYVVAPKAKKFLWTGGGSWGIADLNPGQKPGEGKLDLAGMDLRIDPLVEWKQIYTDAWRIMRDWFYDPDMHRVKWREMHDRYAALLPHVAHRADLDFLLGELIGELNAGHTYVFSGDQPRVERVPVGLLGCSFEPHKGRWRIARIYAGENWPGRARSPLVEAGLNVTEGDYLLAIDGHELTDATSPYALLENKVGVNVALTIGEKPSMEGAREVTVQPIDSELDLLYAEWVKENRRIVDELSGGRIGYIHVPNTHYDGFREFYKFFQPLQHKEALIIDDRYNGGGHSPYDMVEVMSHEVFQYWAARHQELATTPFLVNEGPKVMLINGLSSSGGDAFPTYFRKAELGPLMGETTWGGLIGYGFSPGFVDGGGLAVPGFAFVNTEGEWDVEAVGVDPDVYVFDDPTLIQAGRQPMIEKAVEYLLEELKAHPRREVKAPEGPDRS